MTSAPIKFKRVSISKELLYKYEINLYIIIALFIVDHKYWFDDDWIKSEYNYILKCQPYIIAFCNYTKLRCIRTSKTIIERYKKHQNLQIFVPFLLCWYKFGACENIGDVFWQKSRPLFAEPEVSSIWKLSFKFVLYVYIMILGGWEWCAQKYLQSSTQICSLL